MATKSASAPVAASGIIITGPARLRGFYVNSTTAGTLVLYDGTSAGGTALSATITPAIGWNEFPVDLKGGLYATVGGTLNVTFFTET